jgi:hypothetical protein
VLGVAGHGILCSIFLSSSFHGSRVIFLGGKKVARALGRTRKKDAGSGASGKLDAEGYVGHREIKLTRSNQSTNRWTVKMDDNAIYERKF